MLWKLMELDGVSLSLTYYIILLNFTSGSTVSLDDFENSCKYSEAFKFIIVIFES